MGLLLGLPGRSLQRPLFSVSSVVWEELPCAVRGPGKRLHGGGGEPDQLEERWGRFLQPAAPSPPRCLRFLCLLLNLSKEMHLLLRLCCNFWRHLQGNKINRFKMGIFSIFDNKFYIPFSPLHHFPLHFLLCPSRWRQRACRYVVPESACSLLGDDWSV